MLGFWRNAMTFLPESPITHGRLLCLRHYRIARVGWSFLSDCVTCADLLQERLRSVTGGLVPAEASACNICRRQPPTLRDMALHTVFTVSRNMHLFDVKRDVTYEQYVSAITSGRATVTGLLPEFPYVSIRNRYGLYYDRLYHP
jgi:hypothetical protein